MLENMVENFDEIEYCANLAALFSIWGEKFLLTPDALRPDPWLEERPVRQAGDLESDLVPVLLEPDALVLADVGHVGAELDGDAVPSVLDVEAEGRGRVDALVPDALVDL